MSSQPHTKARAPDEPAMRLRRTAQAKANKKAYANTGSVKETGLATVYDSLFPSSRQQLHRRIAETLEADFAEATEAEDETLAHRFMEAGLSERAITYWDRAGRRAAERSILAKLPAPLHLLESPMA